MTGIEDEEQAIRERAWTLPEYEGAAEPGVQGCNPRPLVPGRRCRRASCPSRMAAGMRPSGIDCSALNPRIAAIPVLGRMKNA
jgi:hypothetical protein